MKNNPKMISKWIYLKTVNNYQRNMIVLRHKKSKKILEIIINVSYHPLSLNHLSLIKRVDTFLIIGDLTKTTIVPMDIMLMFKVIH